MATSSSSVPITDESSFSMGCKNATVNDATSWIPFHYEITLHIMTESNKTAASVSLRAKRNLSFYNVDQVNGHFILEKSLGDFAVPTPERFRNLVGTETIKFVVTLSPSRLCSDDPNNMNASGQPMVLEFGPYKRTDHQIIADRKIDRIHYGPFIHMDLRPSPFIHANQRVANIHFKSKDQHPKAGETIQWIMLRSIECSLATSRKKLREAELTIQQCKSAKRKLTVLEEGGEEGEE